MNIRKQQQKNKAQLKKNWKVLCSGPRRTMFRGDIITGPTPINPSKAQKTKAVKKAIRKARIAKMKEVGE